LDLGLDFPVFRPCLFHISRSHSVAFFALCKDRGTSNEVWLPTAVSAFVEPDKRCDTGLKAKGTERKSVGYGLNTMGILILKRS